MLRCPAKDATVSSRTDSHRPAKGNSSHTPNGSSPMCNQVYRTRPDDSLAAQAHILATMELEHRPYQAILTGDLPMANPNLLHCWPWEQDAAPYRFFLSFAAKNPS